LASQDFNKKDLAILVDEKFGSDIIKQAHQKNITLCIPVEKSGQSFAFEYGKILANIFLSKILIM